MAVTAFILRTEAPETGKPGDIIPVKITAKQSSDFASDILHSDGFKYLVFIDGKQAQQQVTLPNNQEVTSTINVLMPDKDLTATVELWTNEFGLTDMKKDETIIRVTKGTVTGMPKKKEETEVNWADKLFGDTTTLLIVVLLVVIIAFFLYRMSEKR